MVTGSHKLGRSPMSHFNRRTAAHEKLPKAFVVSCFKTVCRAPSSWNKPKNSRERFPKRLPNKGPRRPLHKQHKGQGDRKPWGQCGRNGWQLINKNFFALQKLLSPIVCHPYCSALLWGLIVQWSFRSRPIGILIMWCGSLVTSVTIPLGGYILLEKNHKKSSFGPIKRPPTEIKWKSVPRSLINTTESEFLWIKKAIITHKGIPKKGILEPFVFKIVVTTTSIKFVRCKTDQ